MWETLSLNCFVIPKIYLDLHSIVLLDLFYRLHCSCHFLHKTRMGVGKRPALLSGLKATPNPVLYAIDKVSLWFTKQLDMSQKLTYDAGPLKFLQTGIATHWQVIRCNQDIKQWGFIPSAVWNSYSLINARAVWPPSYTTALRSAPHCCNSCNIWNQCQFVIHIVNMHKQE